MALFVLVVDTSLMNVSISAVVRDLDTTVSGVQSAIALEALVSAAFRDVSPIASRIDENDSVLQTEAERPASRRGYSSAPTTRPVATETLIPTK
jgi:hypothetical protein